MKFESADLKVGTLVLVAIGIAVGGLFWLRPKEERGLVLYTRYERLDGLAEQSDVEMDGFAIGKVDRVEPVPLPRGGLTFRVTMRIDPRFARGDTLFIPAEARARLQPPAIPVKSGFVSGSIVLDLPSRDSLSGRLLHTGDSLPAATTGSMLADVQKLAREITPQVTQTLTQARELMKVLVRTSTAAAELAEASIGLMDSTKRQVPALLSQVQGSLRVTDSILRDVQRTTPALKPLLDSVQVLVNASKSAATTANGMMTDWRPRLDRIVANSDTISGLLTTFSKEVTRRPWKVITGVKPTTKRE